LKRLWKPQVDEIASRLPHLSNRGGGTLHMSSAVAPCLEALGLNRFDALFSLEAPFLDRNRLRDVIRIEVSGVNLYRKRQHGIKRRDRFRALLRGSHLRSHSREETRHLLQLSSRGFRVPRPAVLGEGAGGRSLLLVEELEGTPLDAFLEEGGDVDAAATAVHLLLERLLTAQVFWPDLDARHIFLRSVPEGLDAGILDVQRLRVGRALGRGARARMRDRLERSLGMHPAGERIFRRVEGWFSS